MPRTIMVGEVATGRRITHLPVASCSWSMVHRGPGEIVVSLPLAAEDFARMEPTTVSLAGVDVPVWGPGAGLRPGLLAALDPARCFLAVLDGDQVLEAGPIWAHGWDPVLRQLTVKAAGLMSLFDHRFVMGVVADGAEAAEWTVTHDGLSLATHAKRLIELAMSHTGGDLPIVLPDDEAGDSSRTWNGYDLPTVGDRLRQLMGVINGPDIALQPRLTDDRLGVEWVLRAGTVDDPMLHQHSGDVTWDARATQGGVGEIAVDRDASGLAQRAWVTGSGQQTSLLMEFADDTTLVGAGYPLLETAEARSTVEERATVAAWAAGNLDAVSRPWMTWKLKVRADQAPRLGAYRPGDWARVWVPASHPYLSLIVPDGYHRARILRVDGDLSEFVTVSMAPQREIR